MEEKIVYFEKDVRENTETTFRIAKQRADELGIKIILIASTGGGAAARAAEVFEGIKVVAVGHAIGWREPNTNEFTEENRRIVENKGGAVLLTKHAFTGLTRRQTPIPAAGTPPVPLTGPVLEVGDIISNTLRIFCGGIKVVVEIAVMAADAGLVRTDEDVIAVAGSERGADTAVVLRPANSRDLFRLRIKEILCKPVFATG